MDKDVLTVEGGYILLARKIIDSEIWFKPPLYLKVWIYLLAKAQHKDYRGLKKGQLSISIPLLREACHWYVGCRKMVPTKDQVFQVLDWLRGRCAQGGGQQPKATMVATVKATRGMVVTINNYTVYQNPRVYESNAGVDDAQAPRATRKQRQPDTTNKNDKNEKIDSRVAAASVKAEKKGYAEFVALTDAEYGKLVDGYGEVAAKRMVEILNNYKGASGKRYRSDYLAMESWVVERFRQETRLVAGPKVTIDPPSPQAAWEEVRSKLVTDRASPLVWSHEAVARAVKNTGYTYILESGDGAMARFIQEYREVTG